MNVAGIMFEPYIELAKLLNKNIVVISDNDNSLSDDLQNSQRFNNLQSKCNKLNIKLRLRIRSLFVLTAKERYSHGSKEW